METNCINIYFYSIGQEGISDLIKTDSCFKSFEQDLFAKKVEDFQRAIADKGTNEKLDKKLEKFLLLLSPYLEKQSALKALEWLVNR